MLNMELARRTQGYTQADVSVLARVAQTFISAIETGNAVPNPDQRGRIAKVLGVPAETLLDEVPMPWKTKQEPTAATSTT